MKKKLLLFILISSLCLTTFGCNKNEKNENKTTNQNEENKQEEVNKSKSNLSENFAAKVNGKTFRTGDSFEKVKSILGNETKPFELSKPCGVEMKGDSKRHFFEDAIVIENYQGIVYVISISKFETPNTKLEFTGIKMKNSFQTVKDNFKNIPIKTEYDGMITFGDDNLYASFTFTDENELGFVTIEDKTIEI